MMEEVIKYFESLEARIAENETRLAALEQAQAAAEAKLQANAEKLLSNEAKLVAIGERIARMMDILKEAQQQKAAAPVVEQKPVVEEPVIEPEPEPIVEEPVIEDPIIEPEPVAEPEPVKEEVTSPHAAMYGKAVDDIRLAISLGDRFLYQRELFGQNAELMQRTLAELNELHSFDEALNYISRFNWDTESNSYQQFIVTLHRRFG
ncbi:MAG: hypothetical protein K6F10_02700 [Paludibacteraceae bacterium]|nr:hypothetical protein [Paludibacteraceae bacterium]